MTKEEFKNEFVAFLNAIQRLRNKLVVLEQKHELSGTTLHCLTDMYLIATYYLSQTDIEISEIEKTKTSEDVNQDLSIIKNTKISFSSFDKDFILNKVKILEGFFLLFK